MIKNLALGVWICAVFAGTLYFKSMPGDAGEDGTATILDSQDYVALSPIAVPMIRHNEIRGYAIVEVGFTIDPQLQARTSVPIEQLLRSYVFSSLYTNKSIDIFRLETVDLDEIVASIKERVSEDYGTELVSNILIQSMEFMSKSEIRDYHLRRS